MADLKAFAEQLVNLTVKEVNELATILKKNTVLNLLLQLLLLLLALQLVVLLPLKKNFFRCSIEERWLS